MPRGWNGFLEFGPYRIDLQQRLLMQGSDVIALAPKVFDTLLVLVESGGRVIEKETLLKTVWPDAFVEEGSLPRNVSTLRKALGEGPHDEKYIVTVPKRGYRFVATVVAGAAAPALNGGASETTEPPALPRSLVGRDRELERLAGHFQRMLAGTGNFVFISGEAGIGKSTLAEEFIGSMRRLHPALSVATGRAVEQYGTGEAYLPFLDAFSGLLRDHGDSFAAILRDQAPTWALQLPVMNSAFDSDRLRRDTAGATRNRMLREMGDALGALSSTAPLLLLLEDLHWADASTIDLLRYLCHRIPAQRVLILATFRPEALQIENDPLKNCMVEMHAHHQCDEIALDVLSTEDIANLLHLRFKPNDFPRELAPLIRKRTDGQPLFTVSLLEFLAGRGDIAYANSRWTLVRRLGEMDLEIPDSVRAMIRKKIEALDSTARLALQYASVQGEEFLSTIVAKLLDRDVLNIEEQLAGLAKTHRLIELLGEEELPDGALASRYRFAHALYQNVLYDDMVTQRRAALHARAGEELLHDFGDGASRIAPQLAMHFERGRNWARAVEFLTIAGDQARRVDAGTQAEEHYTHALQLSPKLTPDACAQAELRIYEKRSAVYLATSRFDASLADGREMIDRARRLGSLELECLALYALGNTLFWAHRLYEMQTVLNDVLRLAKRTPAEAARLQAMALLAQGHLALGELDQAENEFHEVIDRASVIDKRTLLGVLDVRARLRFFRSEYIEAENLFRETLNLASELGDTFEFLKSHYFLTLTLANLGRISEALEVLNRAMDTARRNGDSFWSARVPNCIGWIHRELQDFDSAMAFDREGAEAAGRLKIGEAEVNSVINLAFDHLQTGNEEHLHWAMQSAESLLSREPWFRWRFEIRLLAARAEQSFAKSDALCLLQRATHSRARKYMVVAHTLLARIAMVSGDTVSAGTELNAAIEILRDFPAPLAAWKTYAALGSLEAGLGRTEAARAAFTQAASIIGYIADHIGDPRLRGVFLGSAAIQEVRSGTRSVAQ